MKYFGSVTTGFPDLATLPEFHAEAAELRRLDAEQRDVGNRLHHLVTVKRDIAQAADREAYAAAVRAAEGDPGQPRTDEVNAEIDDLQRRYEALTLAVDLESADFHQRVVEHRADWVQLLNEHVEDARGRYAMAVDKLAEARRALAERRADAAWVAEFPNARHRVLEAPLRHGQANRQPFEWQLVVDCMRTEVQASSLSQRVNADPAA